MPDASSLWPGTTMTWLRGTTIGTGDTICYSRAVKQNSKPVLRNALDMLKIEYAKVGQKLTKEACTPPGGPNAKGPAGLVDEYQVKNVDCTEKALDQLIDQLESILEQRDWGAADADADSEVAKELLEPPLGRNAMRYF